jgi:cyclophilin family peptidyl-prolyl cis-trans isomerase
MLAVGIGLLLGLTLTVEPAKKEIVLGEPVELKVKVEGREKDMPAVAFDQRSLTVTIGDGDSQFVYQRKSEKPLAAEKDEATIKWTPVRAGEYPIEVAYAGKASAETKVTVKPAKDGETELGMMFITSKGEIKFRFFPEKAPNHVAHFADRVREGFYNGQVFHRVIKGFMAQGGDPTGTGRGGPGYTIPAEFTKDPKYSHTFGRLSTARTPDPNSAGSQFFLCFDNATFLDGQYTCFGELVDGHPVVRKIEEIGADRDPAPPKELVKIERAALVPLKSEKSGS